MNWLLFEELTGKREAVTPPVSDSTIFKDNLDDHWMQHHLEICTMKLGPSCSIPHELEKRIFAISEYLGDCDVNWNYDPSPGRIPLSIWILSGDRLDLQSSTMKHFIENTKKQQGLLIIAYKRQSDDEWHFYHTHIPDYPSKIYCYFGSNISDDRQVAMYFRQHVERIEA